MQHYGSVPSTAENLPMAEDLVVPENALVIAKGWELSTDQSVSPSVTYFYEDRLPLISDPRYISLDEDPAVIHLTKSDYESRHSRLTQVVPVIGGVVASKLHPLCSIPDELIIEIGENTVKFEGNLPSLEKSVLDTTARRIGRATRPLFSLFPFRPIIIQEAGLN